MTTAWSHLPNAKHIDRVLAHLEAHPDKWDAAQGAAWGAARGAIAALVAWDNCAHLLELTPDQLRVYSRLSDDPAAALLLPAVIALEV